MLCRLTPATPILVNFSPRTKGGFFMTPVSAVNLDHSELVAELSRLPLLSELPPEDRDVLAELAAFATFPGGTLITDEGAPLSSLWILIEGRASVEVGKGATRTLVATLDPGALLGEASYLSGRP